MLRRVSRICGNCRGRDCMGSDLPFSLVQLAEITMKIPSSSDPSHENPDIPVEAAFTGFFPEIKKTFPFTTIWSHENFSREIIELLPNIDQSEIIFEMFEAEIAMFFSAWHLPTLKADFRAFFRLDARGKAVTPMALLSLYLMICSLGVLLRASQKEIFGREGNSIQGGMNIEDEENDMTSSRLQSELYRK